MFGGFCEEVGFVEGFVGGIDTVVESMFDVRLSCLDGISVEGNKRNGRC